MSIRWKILLTVLPLLIATLIVTGISSTMAAENGLTRIAVDFLAFKAEELNRYADSQWQLLVDNGLAEQDEFTAVARQAVAAYAATLIRSATESVLALDDQGQLAFATTPPTWTDQERETLAARLQAGQSGWIEYTDKGQARVGQAFAFEPFGWHVLLTEARETFFGPIAEINLQNQIILGFSLLLATILALIFAVFLTRPLQAMVKTMNRIVDGDLSQRVTIEYNDEIGRLAGTFNTMVSELEYATNQIKNFAFQAVLARKNETKIRQVFQKYVPANVIEEFFAKPEQALVGENRDLAVLFSDIRDFTTISEMMVPDHLVEALNRYFSGMVDAVMNRGGIVDKYIGDAIMAFFGAPAKGPNDALASVLCAFEMLAALGRFNQAQREAGAAEFRIGIGINFGLVTVGNIGSERKMDYTVIGDMVNLASRLEGLTKMYRQELIISQRVYQKIGRQIWCRFVDKVQVKGKTFGEPVYTAKARLTETEKRAWACHHSGIEAYYQRRFSQAQAYFRQTLELLPGDWLAQEFVERCGRYAANPPPADWSGVEVLHEK